MEPRDVAERYYEAVNTSDAATISAVLTDDCKVEAPGVSLTGPEQITGWMQVFFDALPDIDHEHEELAVDGNTIRTVLHITGTHTGPLVSPQGEIPPSGRSVAFDVKNEMTVKDDKVAGLNVDFDQMDLMRQLGAG